MSLYDLQTVGNGPRQSALYDCTKANATFVNILVHSNCKPWGRGEAEHILQHSKDYISKEICLENAKYPSSTFPLNPLSRHTALRWIILARGKLQG